MAATFTYGTATFTYGTPGSAADRLQFEAAL